MILAIDIGNTNLTFGLLDGKRILHQFLAYYQSAKDFRRVWRADHGAAVPSACIGRRCGRCSDLFGSTKDHVFPYKRNQEVSSL